MTFVPYPDITATSPDGSFRIEVSGRPAKGFFRDQADFRYRLMRGDEEIYDVASSALDERSMADFPHAAWVSDGGWVVVRTHNNSFAGLFVLSPEGTLRFSMEHQGVKEGGQGFLDGQPERYFGASSAGPFWAARSFAWFFAIRDKPHWALRTWWGSRVIIELESGTLLGDSGELVAMLEVHEEAWVTSTLGRVGELQAAAERIRQDWEKEDWSADSWYEFGEPVVTAAHHSGMLRLHGAADQLRSLEQIELWPSYTTSSWAGISHNSCASIARLALLRLGERPLWRPSYEFVDRATDTPVGRTHSSSHREEALLEVGVDQRQLLRELGPPDFLCRGSSSIWEYDFCEPDGGHSIRLHWSDEPAHSGGIPRAERIEQVEPPEWLQICDRDLWWVAG